jgi:leucyl aminopeptidase
VVKAAKSGEEASPSAGGATRAGPRQLQIAVARKPLPSLAVDALVVGLPSGEKRWPEALTSLDHRADGLIRSALDAEKFTGKAGAVTHVHVGGRLASPRVVVVGIGPRREVTAETIRRAAAAGLRRARDLGARSVGLELLGDRLSPRQRAHALTEGVVLGTYAFERYKREASERFVEQAQVVPPDGRGARDVAEGIRTGLTFARATWFARDLVNAPANEVHPTHLAEVAETIAQEGRLSLRIYDRVECEKLGMGAFLGVAAGSQQPPKFIHLTYRGPGRPTRRIAIVGKGITFDSGGLDLKTADGMLRMKDDMSGAAAVLATMRALPSLKPRVEVHGLIAATENMPSGTAFRPGDVLRAMNGTTIEIGNTDAEGRLTLADALSYAVQEVKPDEIIDLATLTGACVVALGPLCSGLMANHQGLTNRLLAAAEAAGERVWQLPLLEEYRDHLKSEIADLNNVGPRGGGAITAGLFLKEFAAGVPWAHLDIAGPAFVDKDGPLTVKGATGVGVRTLLTYLTGQKA